MAACTERQVREHNASMLAAYWTARLGREKSMTPLRELLIETERAPPKQMTNAEIEAAFDSWVIATGGTLPDALEPKQEEC